MNTALPSDAALMALSGLSTGLWRIQELIEVLSYKLEVQQVLMENGRTRWMGRSTREIEAVIAEMREAELMRAVDAGPVCDALGLAPDTPLSEIAAAAPAPWDQVLGEHRNALTTATNELSRLSRSNSEMLEASYRAVQETLERFNHSPEGATYTASGTRESRRSLHLFDQRT
ncbi:flagellar export chaperone FlgN [Agilicoccus flavus]|uniref:flagellar export chaperone FlgN n=1 Tax=Agilicoccus flavus TaxID=2775968 RepID=UPI001CF60A13|nr:flagellar export chaperone FlgN [Agilicoccus flavus]